MIKQTKKTLAYFEIEPNKLAFTLVELIVVITILAILGTIAFISLQGYSAQARDSKRLSDISNIKKSIELFSLNTGKNPIPDEDLKVSYLGEILRFQGTIGDDVTTNLSRNLNEKPVDPLTGEEYIYSTTYTQTEYEVLGLYESELISFVTPSLYNVSATNNIQNYPKIDGNYNGIYIKTFSYYVPTPSIINANVWGNIEFAENETLIESQVVTGGNNLPGVSTGGLDIALSVYEGTITKDSTDEEKTDLIQAIQTTYSGSILANDMVYADLLSRTSQTDIDNYIDNVILNTGNYQNLVIDASNDIVTDIESNTDSSDGCYIYTSDNKIKIGAHPQGIRGYRWATEYGGYTPLFSGIGSSSVRYTDRLGTIDFDYQYYIETNDGKFRLRIVNYLRGTSQTGEWGDINSIGDISSISNFSQGRLGVSWLFTLSMYKNGLNELCFSGLSYYDGCCFDLY